MRRGLYWLALGLAGTLGLATSGSQGQDAILARPDPATIPWAPSSGRDCETYHGRRYCNGPRRVPQPTDTEAAEARALGLVGPVARRALSENVPTAWIEAATGPAVTSDLLWPVPAGRLWRGFGMRRGFRRRGGRLERTRAQHRHEGVDIGASEGSVIVAVNDGLVAYSDNTMHGYGNAVIIVHRDGSVTLYAHCVETYVVAGARVRRGQVIAAVGQTGIAHGAHLHLEYRRGGHVEDPIERFVQVPDAQALRRARATVESSPARAPEAGHDEPPDEWAESDVPTPVTPESMHAEAARPVGP